MVAHIDERLLVAVIPTLALGRSLRLAHDLTAQGAAVIIVDNSAAIAGCRRSDGVTILSAGRNLGFGAAVMFGASSVSHELLLVLNDDVVPEPGFIAALTRPFRNPTVHAVAAHLQDGDGSRVDTLGLAVDRTLRAADALAACDVPTIIGPSGAAAAYRRRTFLELGGYAPELFAYWEDVDLALRLWAAGHPCHVATQAVAHHTRGTTLGRRSARQRELDAYGRGFILGRYRAWMTPTDRLLVSLVDWPSLLRSIYMLGGLSVLKERASGRRAGTHRPAAPPPRRPPMRPVWQSLFPHWRQTILTRSQRKAPSGGRKDPQPAGSDVGGHSWSRYPPA